MRQIRSLYRGLSLSIAVLIAAIIPKILADVFGGDCVVRDLVCPPAGSVPREVFSMAHIVSDTIITSALALLATRREVARRSVRWIFGSTDLPVATGWFRLSFWLLLVSSVLIWTRKVHVASLEGWLIFGTDRLGEILQLTEVGPGLDVFLWMTSDSPAGSVFLSDLLSLAFLCVYFAGLVWFVFVSQIPSEHRPSGSVAPQ